MKRNILILIAISFLTGFSIYAPVYAGYGEPPALGTRQTATNTNSKEFDSIKIQEKLAQQIDLKGLHFNDENDQPVSLAKYFKNGKPAVLTLMYYSCPGICSLLVKGEVKAMRRIALRIGKDFNVVTVSIDPNDKPITAAAKKVTFLKDYAFPGAENGVHFLTGQKDQIKKLADQVGFGFRKLKNGQYAHSGGFFVLTPKGKISRVFYGLQFKPLNLKLALVKASNGQIGNFVDQILCFCYRYDPNAKGYSLAAFRVMQAGGGLTVLLVGAYLFFFWLRQRRIAKNKSKV